MSGGENTAGKDYACCTFRGHLDALDAETGALDWRYYTVPEPKQVGTWPSGAAKYEPSGVGVSSSPVTDPRSGTLFAGTGQNYTGGAGDFDTLLALDARSGTVRWKSQVTKADTWRSPCNDPEPEGYCPGLGDGSSLDYDIGATPNIPTYAKWADQINPGFTTVDAAYVARVRDAGLEIYVHTVNTAADMRAQIAKGVDPEP